MEQGGHAISFVQEFYHHSFPEAVTLLLGREQSIGFQQAEPKQQREQKPFVLPERHSNNRRLYAYLTKQRQLDPDVISHFVRAGTLYEDAVYHNTVFVGQDENGVPRHAHKRTTLSMGQSYRGNMEGSDARYGFCHRGTSDRLYVFEAPIDFMSYVSLNKQDWQNHSYLALCGVADHALMHTLERHSHIQMVMLCLDNDAARISAADRIREKLKQEGYTDVSLLLSCEKDWNADLVAKCEITQTPLELNMSM